MTFDKMKWAKADVGYSYEVQQIFNYIKIDETLATIVASGYFNSITADLRKYDIINIQASDDVNIYQVTSTTGATTVTIASIIDASIIPDGAITNAKVNAAALIDWSKMALLTEGNLLLGNGSNVATVTDFSTDTQIGVGDGTTFASVAVSGDATLANTGALTIAANAITTAKILDANVTLAKLAAGITPSHVARYAGKHSYGGGGTSDAATVTGVVAGDIVIATIEAATNACYLAKAVPTTDTITFHFSADPGASTVVSYTVLNAAS